MIVISKKDTKRLIKGVRYEVENLWNNGNIQSWLNGKVQIKGIGRFDVDNFTDDNGNPLPRINYSSNTISTRESLLSFSDIKEGDILVCTSDYYKTLLKGGMYKVESKIEIQNNKYSWSRNDEYIKFKGVERKLKFNPWNFRSLNAEESRDISLMAVLEDVQPDIITTTKFRKIDKVENKDIELIKTLAKSIIDPNRHHLSVVEWACRKTGSNLGLVVDDYKSLMDLTLSDILKILDNE